jgi:hypothetical protein
VGMVRVRWGCHCSTCSSNVTWPEASWQLAKITRQKKKQLQPQRTALGSKRRGPRSDLWLGTEHLQQQECWSQNYKHEPPALGKNSMSI